jgi:glycosyltransferase involved in cell wall biosynthesis
VTHSLNLKRFVSSYTDLAPNWIDVPFRPDHFIYKVPPLSLNWTLRGSLYARRALGESNHCRFQAMFVHTMTIALLADDLYERVPTIISIDATPTNLDQIGEAYGHRRLPSAVEDLKCRLVIKALKKAREFVAWSEWAKSSLVQDYGLPADRVHVITPGTDLDLFSAFGKTSGTHLPRILFVGGDFLRKGGDVLMTAFRQRLLGKAELHLVTGAEIGSEEGVFVYRGLTSNSDALRELYRTADIFALPTRADCLAVVLGEAMAASLPIVTTHVGAHAEAVIDGETGVIIDPDDEKSLGDALELLVDNPGLRTRMGQAGRERAETNFDAQKNALRIVELLRGIA